MKYKNALSHNTHFFNSVPSQSMKPRAAADNNEHLQLCEYRLWRFAPGAKCLNSRRERSHNRPIPRDAIDGGNRRLRRARRGSGPATTCSRSRRSNAGLYGVKAFGFRGDRNTCLLDAYAYVCDLRWIFLRASLR